MISWGSFLVILTVTRRGRLAVCLGRKTLEMLPRLAIWFIWRVVEQYVHVDSTSKESLAPRPRSFVTNRLTVVAFSRVLSHSHALSTSILTSELGLVLPVVRPVSYTVQLHSYFYSSCCYDTTRVHHHKGTKSSNSDSFRSDACL